MHRSGNVPFYPQDHLTPYILEGLSLCPGRSSDFPALLATFPFIREQWYAMAKRVPFSNKIGKRWDYSGGPVPEFHGVPY
jgi:hypothetical protein